MPTFATPEAISVTLELGVATCGSTRASAPTPSSRSARATQRRVGRQGRRAGASRLTPPAHLRSPDRSRAFLTSPASTVRSTYPSNCPWIPRFSPSCRWVTSSARHGWESSASRARRATCASNSTGPLRVQHLRRPPHRRHDRRRRRHLHEHRKGSVGEVDGSIVVKNSNGSTEIETVRRRGPGTSGQRRHLGRPRGRRRRCQVVQRQHPPW